MLIPHFYRLCIFIDYDDGLGTKWPPPPTPTKISFCTSSLYPGGIGGSTISITRRQLCSGPEVKPISSHSYEGKHHVAEIQVESIMDGDGLRKLAEISGVAGHRWGAGLGGLLQMNTYRFSRKTAFDLVRQD